MSTEIQTLGGKSGLKCRDEAAALIKKYDHALAIYGGDRAYTFAVPQSIIPRCDLAILVPALSAALRPASAKEVAGAAALIATAWPFSWQRLDDQTAEAFAQQLSQEMSRFPADVLLEVIKDLRRSLKFAPSIAEICHAAEEEMAHRRGRLLIAEQHEKEHERRAQAAREAAERRAKHRRDMQSRRDTLIRHHGEAFARWTVEDVDAASGGIHMAGLSVLRDWLDGIEAGDRWVVRVMPLAVVAGAVWPLYRAHHLTSNHVRELLLLGRRDIDAAIGMLQTVRQLVTDTPKTLDGVYGPEGARLKQEIARLLSSVAGCATETSWGDPSRFLADLIDESRNETPKAA